MTFDDKIIVRNTVTKGQIVRVWDRWLSWLLSSSRFLLLPNLVWALVPALRSDPEPMPPGEPGPALLCTMVHVTSGASVSGGHGECRYARDITFGASSLDTSNGLHYYCMVCESQISGQFMTWGSQWQWQTTQGQAPVTMALKPESENNINNVTNLTTLTAVVPVEHRFSNKRFQRYSHNHIELKEASTH